MDSLNYSHVRQMMCRFHLRVLCTLIAVAGISFERQVLGHPSQATESPPQPRCILLEIYLQKGQPVSERALKQVRELESSRKNLVVVVREIGDDERNQERLNRIREHFKISQPALPLIYGCNRAIYTVQDLNRLPDLLKQMLRLDVYVRDGCQRCLEAKRVLPKLLRNYPAIELRYFDVGVDVKARNELNTIARNHRTTATSLPVFYGSNQVIVGFDRPETTGQRVQELFQRWSVPCPVPASSSTSEILHKFPNVTAVVPVAFIANKTHDASFVSSSRSSERLLEQQQNSMLAVSRESDSIPDKTPETESAQNTPDTAFGDLDFELPIGDDNSVSDVGASGQKTQIALPVFGLIDVREIGMPMFTIAVGLVDGFNPCAMWVLLFLLSILVNLRDRARILAVAGTFVVVSGLAYFAFMVAWLNVFLLIGYLRPIQIGLGLLAIAVGSIHVKDFFAFKKGISLSIPESAKPHIYHRVRKIVNAENLTGAIVGATVLAILVNVVELLCTAGLPALYTQILSLQQYPVWKNYAYIALYNIAYMFDDSMMVLLVVWTLGKRKMQQREGEWLKLISGLVIMALGLVMIVKPDWLH